MNWCVEIYFIGIQKIKLTQKIADSHFFVSWFQPTKTMEKKLANFFCCIYSSFGFIHLVFVDIYSSSSAWFFFLCSFPFFMEIDILSTWIIKWGDENRDHDEVVTFTSSVQIICGNGSSLIIVLSNTKMGIIYWQLSMWLLLLLLFCCCWCCIVKIK